ncbi:MAG: 30S ribosomal protein S21 [Anaerolineae bacterium]
MSVDLRPGESPDSLLKRFRKEVVKDRILSTYRKKRWYVSKSEQRRLAKQRAIRKARRKMLRRQNKRRGRR